MIIALGSEKGGVGKTTILVNFASLLTTKENRDVCIVDGDKQGSASSWASIRDENSNLKRIPAVQKFGDTSFISEVKDMSNRYQDLIIDTGGRDSIELRSAMTVADILFVPVVTSSFDIWTLGNMNSLIGIARTFNPKLRAVLFINRASTNASSTETRDAFEIIKDFKNFEIHSNPIKDRIAFRKSAALGVSVCEMTQGDSKAIEEIKKLFGVILEHEK